MRSTLENTFCIKQAAPKEEDLTGPQKKEQITMLDVWGPRPGPLPSPVPPPPPPPVLTRPCCPHTQPRKTYNLAILLNRILSTHSMDWFKGV
jgi:hypothetical protein